MSFWKLLTNPFQLGFAILLPIFMYLMFGANQDYSDIWLGHATVAATVLANMAIYGAIMSASTMGALVALERTSGVTRLFALTPLSPAVQMAARVLATLGVSAIVIVITYVVGHLTGARMEGQAWVTSGLAIVILSMLPATLGLAAGYATRSDAATALTSAITVIASFGSGMFIPLDQMGALFQQLAPWTPFFGIVQLVQLPLMGWEGMNWAWVVNYVAWTLIFAAVSVWGQRRDTGR